MGEEEGRHVRRKRYRGDHPRSFSEKYKERNPEKYPEELERVLARGDTPAGSHRSIMVREILEILSPRPGETALDATLGYGGHAREVLKAILPGGRLIGLDRDPVELGKTSLRFEEAGFPPGSFIPIHASFAELPDLLLRAGIAGTGGTAALELFLADLGLSSMQIDDPERGFSWKRRGPLDMRMDVQSGPSARDYLASVSEPELREALAANADEEHAASIARAILARRGRLETTRDLAEAICTAFPQLAFKDPAMARILRRCFQAIRIEVNGEFAALETLLAALPSALKAGGRAAFLAFHSGEDGRIEASLSAGLEAGLYSAISPEPLRPSQEERYGNPRSSSAKLRWAIRSERPAPGGSTHG